MMRTSLAFLLFALLLVMGAIAHLGTGARYFSPTVVQAFVDFDPRNFDHNIIIRLRLLRLPCGHADRRCTWRGRRLAAVRYP